MSEQNGSKPLLALVPTEGMSEERVELIPLRRMFQEGDVIFSEGEAGDTLFIVEKGEVQITRPHPHQMMRITIELAVVGKGGILGDGAVFGNTPRSATALARLDCQLLEFTKEQFLGIFLTGGERAEGILRSLLRRIYQTNERYLEKLCQVVDLEERLRVLESERLDAGWFEKKSGVELSAKEGALEQARTEIAGLRGEVHQLKRILNEESERWSQHVSDLRTKGRDLKRENEELRREQAVLLDSFGVAKQRRANEVESADEAVRLAYEEIELLKNQLEATRIVRETLNQHPLSKFSRSILPKDLLAALDALARKPSA